MPAASRGPQRLPVIGSVILALLGGLLLDVAAPGGAWWPAAFAGVACISVSLWHQRATRGAWLGALAGLAFWLPHIDWLTLYLGPIPWLALSGMMVLWFALLGAVIAFVTRVSAERLTRRPVRAVLQLLVVTGLWVTRESVQGSWPYDGFAWGRLAHTQSISPLADLVSWVGFSGLTAFVALLSIAPVAAGFTLIERSRKIALRGIVATAVGSALVFTLGAVVPLATLPVSDEIRVAAVQGNSKSGVFDDRESGDVIAAHIETTIRWLANDPDPVDVVVWPENSAEFNLPDQSRHLRQVENLARKADAPLVVGTILADGRGEARTYTNSSLVVDPDTGVGDRFDKRHPVPFAEYMPHRSFYRALVPDLVDLVQLEYAHGKTSTAVRVDTFLAGVAICFDIIFDDMAVSMVEDGAEIIFAQTNNADFGTTDQSEQQLEIARLRAIETGRAVINISTVATSEIIAPNGETLARIPQWEAGVMESTVPLVSGVTPALQFGAIIAAFWIFVGLGGAAATLSLRLFGRPATST